MSAQESSRQSVVVVGGGITGLSAAFRLQDLCRRQGLGSRVRLLESGQRLGGNVRTEQAGGLLIECGPDQFVTHKPAALELCGELGLSSSLLTLGGGPSVGVVVRRGRPVRLPEGFTLLGPTRLGPLLGSSLFSLAGRTRIVLERWMPPRADAAPDESVASFVGRRFGGEFLRRAAEPLIGGLFTADVERLSVQMSVPRYLDLERRYGSVTRGLRAAAAGTGRGGCASLEGGLGRLVDALGSGLSPDAVLLRTRAIALGRDRADGALSVRVQGGHELSADAVILACPGPAAADLVKGLDADLAADLAALQWADCAVVNLLYPLEAVSRALEGHGFFVPRAEREPILACSYVQTKFPSRVPAGRVLLRAFLGGATEPGVLDRDDGALAAAAHGCLTRLLGIRREPLWSRTYRFPGSMPQYEVGGLARIGRIRGRLQRHPGLAIAGGVMGAVGLPDCIESGAEAARRTFTFVSTLCRAPVAAPG